MRLVELMEVYNPVSKMRIVDYNSDGFIAEYNGKDSIDPKYNDWVVEFVTPWDANLILVTIRNEEV